VSSLLLSSLWRRVAAGGEHRSWWMYCAYLAAEDVASTLAASNGWQAHGGFGHRNFCWSAGKGDHPQTSSCSLVATHNGVPAVDDGAANLSESDAAPCIAHGNNQKERVCSKAGNDVGYAGSTWQRWKVKRACVGG
jgi:hypothetical protein